MTLVAGLRNGLRRRVRGGGHPSHPGLLLVARGAVPCGHHGQQLHVASECLHLPMIRVVQRTIPAKNVRRLPHHETEVRQVERDVFEAQNRARLGLMARDHLFVQLEHREGDAQADAALEFQQLEVHVHRVGELGMRDAQGAELDDLAGFGARGAKRRLRVCGHVAIMTHPFRTRSRP